MIILEFTLLILLFCLFAKIAWANEVKTGDWARYKVRKNDDTPPRITHIEMSILGSEVVDERMYLWWQLTAFENEQIRYTIKLLVENLNFLSSENSDLNADRYLFHETGKRPLEYVRFAHPVSASNTVGIFSPCYRGTNGAHRRLRLTVASGFDGN